MDIAEMDKLYRQHSGLCRAIAAKIALRLGSSAMLVDLVEPEECSLWRYPGKVHHVVVEFQGMLHDVTGAHDPKDLLDTWSSKLRVRLVLERHDPKRADDQGLRRALKS